MTGLDKIIAGIMETSAASVGKIKSDAEAGISAIMNSAEAKADEECARIGEENERRISAATQRAESAARLNRRNRLLAAKQELISGVIDTALRKAESLPDEEYFNTVIAMAARASRAQKGEIRFSEKDLARLPGHFEKKLNAALPSGAVLVVSKQPVNIKSGFLLVYNDGIEENCSFDAVFAARRDEMQDKVRNILF